MICFQSENDALPKWDVRTNQFLLLFFFSFQIRSNAIDFCSYCNYFDYDCWYRWKFINSGCSVEMPKSAKCRSCIYYQVR